MPLGLGGINLPAIIASASAAAVVAAFQPWVLFEPPPLPYTVNPTELHIITSPPPPLPFNPRRFCRINEG